MRLPLLRPARRLAGLVLAGLALVLALPAGGAGAASRYPFFEDAFVHVPVLGGVTGTVPLRTTARWDTQLGILFDAKRWGDYPWYARLFIEWGDGQATELPSTSTAGPLPGLTRRTWKPLTLTHRYGKAGRYAVRLRFQKPGVIDYRPLATVVARAAGTTTAKLAATAAGASVAGAADAADATAVTVAADDPAATVRGDGPAGSCAAGCDRHEDFDIRLMGFTPANLVRVGDPAAACGGAAPGGAGPQPLVLAGDDRGFGADAYRHGRYRAAQRVVLRYWIDRQRFELRRSEARTMPSLAFRAGTGRGSALRHGEAGRLDPADVDAVLGDCNLLHARALPRDDGLAAPRLVRADADTAVLAFTGRALDGLLPAALPALGWNIEVSIERRADRTLVRARGSHGRFPNYELYVDGVPLLRYSTLGESASLPVTALPVADSGAGRPWLAFNRSATLP